jgi:hypothetical protein
MYLTLGYILGDFRRTLGVFVLKASGHPAARFHVNWLSLGTLSQTYICTYSHAFIHPSIHTYMHTYVHSLSS